MFYKGLNTKVKEALIYFPLAETLEELIDQCVSIDQRQFALRKELKAAEKSSAPRSKPPSNPGNNHDGSKPSSNSKKPSYPSNPSHRPGPYNRPGNPSNSRGDNPSTFRQAPSRPRGPVSDEEKARRHANNLCYRCGSPDHYREDCPSAKQAASTNVYATNPPPTPVPRYTALVPRHAPQAPAPPQENWLSQDAARQTS
jgi:hypothetical protein